MQQWRVRRTTGVARGSGLGVALSHVLCRSALVHALFRFASPTSSDPRRTRHFRSRVGRWRDPLDGDHRRHIAVSPAQPFHPPGGARSAALDESTLVPEAAFRAGQSGDGLFGAEHHSIRDRG
jgi:hypothetical protein